MTKLRDQETERGDFIFHADRLSTLIVEKALTLLPYEAQTVQTPLKLPYDGLTRAKEVSCSIDVDRVRYQLTDYSRISLGFRYCDLEVHSPTDYGGLSETYRSVRC